MYEYLGLDNMKLHRDHTDFSTQTYRNRLSDYIHNELKTTPLPSKLKPVEVQPHQLVTTFQQSVNFLHIMNCTDVLERYPSILLPLSVLSEQSQNHQCATILRTEDKRKIDEQSSEQSTKKQKREMDERLPMEFVGSVSLYQNFPTTIAFHPTNSVVLAGTLFVLFLI